MLFHLLDFLERSFQPPGVQAIYFITVRAGLSAATALVLAMTVGKKIIAWLSRNQFGETIRDGSDAGVVDHSHKAGTPTMGGTILLVSILGATLLWGDLTNIYVQVGMLSVAWMGAFGFADDYIKVVKKNKAGLAARTKLVGQISLGTIVGAILYFHPEFADVNSVTDVPFLKDSILDYDFLSTATTDLGWIIYIPVVIFIITALSNSVNLTDGLDGLAAGVTALVALGLTALAYISGNVVLSDFLEVMYLPGTGELTVFAIAMAAACFGFLWFNGYPAQVFMGDTGSLALGAGVGAVALMVKKELLLPVLCGIFFMETASVIIQTTWFKYTKKKTGTGRRVFKMAPLHHHYEAKGDHESKIVIRFWIVTGILVIFTLLSLRVR